MNDAENIIAFILSEAEALGNYVSQAKAKATAHDLPEPHTSAELLAWFEDEVELKVDALEVTSEHGGDDPYGWVHFHSEIEGELRAFISLLRRAGAEPTSIPW